jgi:hypothetical protein
MSDLSPSLNKGLTTAYFKRSGKIPEDNDLLHIWVKGELMKGELIFSNLVDIPSYPKEFLGLRDFIMFSTSLVDIDFKRIFGKVFLKDCVKQ